MKDDKVEFILDLIRRACANGTHRKVAEALSVDWNPDILIDQKGKATFKIGNIK